MGSIGMTDQHKKSSRLPVPDSGAQATKTVQLLLIALRCWWKVATPIGILMAVGAGCLVVYLVKPNYTASTWIQINNQSDSLLPQRSAQDPQKFVQNLLELMRSPPVLESVASLPEVAATPELNSAGDSAQALRDRLKIRAQGKSDYFVMEFTSVIPERAALVVNEVAKSFLEAHRRSESRHSERTIQLLQEQQAAQREIVQSQRDTLTDSSIRLTGKNPFAAEAKDGALQPRNPLAEIQSQLVAVEFEHAVLKVRIQASVERLKSESFTPPLSQVERLLDASQGLGTIRQRIAETQAKMKQHEATSANLQKNSLYDALRKQLADDTALLEKSLTEDRTRITEDWEKSARLARQDEISAMKQDLQGHEHTIQFLQEKLTSGIKSQKEYKGGTLDLEFLRADYERSSKIYERISDRILSLKMEQRWPDRVEIYKEAVIPMGPDEAIPYKMVGLAGLAAFFFPFGIAVAVEWFFRRVSSRDQLESLGFLMVVGEVPELPRAAKRGQRARSRPNRSLQLFEESVDGLRTYLMLADSMRGLQVLAVTSAVSREGKTSLAAQLAVSIASATREPTLLIDGDLRSPEIHDIFAVDSSPGLAEVLKGDQLAEDVIEVEFSDHLHLLTAGSLSTSPHQLLGNGRFSAVLDHLRTMYRHIIVDTPPILPASEALVIARAADAAVLCVRRDFSRMDQATEAFCRLETAGVKVAGVVLNGIPLQSYARRYGGYYYSRRVETAP